MLGEADGVVVGALVGLTVVGLEEGDEDGEFDGAPVGSRVVGKRDGEDDGVTEGDEEGDVVGLEVGDSETSHAFGPVHSGRKGQSSQCLSWVHLG